MPILLFALLYVGNGLIEFLHYFYRGLARSDVESTLTLAQRIATLGCALVALTWHPTLTALAMAMLAPLAITLAFSVWYAHRLGRDAAARGNDVDRWSEEQPGRGLLVGVSARGVSDWRRHRAIGAVFQD